MHRSDEEIQNNPLPLAEEAKQWFRTQLAPLVEGQLATLRQGMEIKSLLEQAKERKLATEKALADVERILIATRDRITSQVETITDKEVVAAAEEMMKIISDVCDREEARDGGINSND